MIEDRTRDNTYSVEATEMGINYRVKKVCIYLNSVSIQNTYVFGSI